MIHDERENVEEDDTQTHTQLKLTALQHRVKLEKEPFRTVPAPSFWFMKTTPKEFSHPDGQRVSNRRQAEKEEKKEGANQFNLDRTQKNNYFIR